MDIDFDITAEMDAKHAHSLKLTISDFLCRYRRFAEDPVAVVVSRPSTDPYDNRITATIKGRSGQDLGKITGDRNGSGTLLFSPSN